MILLIKFANSTVEQRVTDQAHAGTVLKHFAQFGDILSFKLTNEVVNGNH